MQDGGDSRRLDARRTRSVWQKVIDGAAKELGREAIDKWLSQVVLTEVKGDLAVLTAGSQFTADWVERNYGLCLLRLLNAEVDKIARLTVAVAADGLPEAASATRSARARLHSAPIDPHLTFERFVVGKPNELAYAVARRVAETGDAAFNPIFLHSAIGQGKTHLMHAIGNAIRATRPECKVIYLSAEQFMYKFVQALRFRDTLTFKEQFRTVDVLMIDDVQYIAGKDSTQEEFFHTFNALIDQKKQIIISADCSPDQIENLPNRIASRLQWGLVVDIHPADYELRLGILQSKAERIMAEDASVVIDDKILEVLARRISSNVRVLEGALNRLFAFATLVGRPINMEMVHECLADLLRSTERKITIEEVKRRVAAYYNLRLTDLISARRARIVARPRQVAMYLCKTLTTKSLPEIGRGFNRDHTTVIHAVRKIEELAASDSQIADDIENLRRGLEDG